VQFSAATYSVNEGAGSVTITVTRTGNTAGTAAVAYSSSDGSALSGSDYQAVSGTLMFAAGESSKSFSVPIINDTVSEANETFNVSLTSVANANFGSPIGAIVTIVDNDKRGRLKLPRGGIIQKRVLE
jgi:hypothetical protein